MSIIGKDPLTEQTVTVVKAIIGGSFSWAITRFSPDVYMGENYQWKLKVQDALGFQNTALATFHFKQYEIYCLNNRDGLAPCPSKGLPSCHPLGFDTSNFMLAYLCPICSEKHYTKIQVKNYQDTNPILFRECPQTSKPFEILVRSGNGDWHCNRIKITEPETPKIPCPECKGTGEWIGFSSIQPCSRGCLKPS